MFNQNYLLILICVCFVSVTCSSRDNEDIFRVEAITLNTAVSAGERQSLPAALDKLQEEDPTALEIRVHEGVSVDSATEQLTQLAAAGVDLIVAHHPDYTAVVNSVAPQFPETSFAVWRSEELGQPNVFTYDVAAEEAGYVNGRLAVTLSENQKLALVPADTAPRFEQYAAGFRQGAHSLNPDAQIIINQSAEGESGTILQQIVDGVDVFSGSNAAARDVVIENELLWLANETDQNHHAPDFVVVSQLYDWTVAFDEFLYFIKEEGKPGGESYRLTFKNSGILMRFSETFVQIDPIRKFGDESMFDVIDGQVTLP